MTRIVTTTYRYKRQPRKREATLDCPAVVTPRKPTAAPANDDRNPQSGSAIVTTTSGKRLKLVRADQRAAERDDDPEGAAQMRAWLERAKWGLDPAR
jgi:hypothetical protein